MWSHGGTHGACSDWSSLGLGKYCTQTKRNTLTCRINLNHGSMLYKISSAFLDNLLPPPSSFSLLTLSVPEICGAVLLLHNGLGLTCLPTQVWHYCAVFADRPENFYCSYNKLNILSLHKCLHGKIFMNNFPPAFITRLCRKALYVYWPSDAMRAVKPLTLQTVPLKLNYLFLFLCHWLSWAALWVVCVSLLIVEIEG